MLIKDEVSKEEREAAINKKIEEMRQRNEEIKKRYQEIENDKKEAEKFSREALERTKRLQQEQMSGTALPIGSEEETTGSVERAEAVGSNLNIKKHNDEETATTNARPKRESRQLLSLSRKLSNTIDDPTLENHEYRPQRLTENDMPPEDPLYSYLTDRLREGKLCEPISPATQRKKKHSIARSDMSISSSDASSANSSRKVSTASNSSWTSQSSSSSKCYGFANYQPPRKFSACRDYINNRRTSKDKPFVDLCGNDEQETLSANWTRAWDNGKPTNSVFVDYSTSMMTNESTIAAGGTELGPRGNKPLRKKANQQIKKNSSTTPPNWRSREPTLFQVGGQGTQGNIQESTGMTQMMIMTEFEEHLNNNNNMLINLRINSLTN